MLKITILSLVTLIKKGYINSKKLKDFIYTSGNNNFLTVKGLEKLSD